MRSYRDRHYAQVREVERRYYEKNREKIDARKATIIKRNREYIWRAKCRPCMDCGVQYNPWVMQFDHVRGEKVFDLARFGGGCYRLERIEEEIKKCEVVCANCHSERTHRRRI